MTAVAGSGCTLGITAETRSNTIIVAVIGAVDSSVTRRIQEAIRPLLRARGGTVEVDLSAADAPPGVRQEISRRFAAA